MKWTYFARFSAFWPKNAFNLWRSPLYTHPTPTNRTLWHRAKNDLIIRDYAFTWFNLQGVTKVRFGLKNRFISPNLLKICWKPGFRETNLPKWAQNLVAARPGFMKVWTKAVNPVRNDLKPEISPTKTPGFVEFREFACWWTRFNEIYQMLINLVCSCQTRFNEP
jgi:hypothetical protein